MNETEVKSPKGVTKNSQDPSAKRETDRKIPWEPPRMEDVSEQVTAQPYIRFT